MIINGMHLSNHRHWFIENQLAAGRGAITILHHLMFPRDPVADQWGDVENQFWFVKLRDGWPDQGIPARPDRVVHVRMFHANWCVLNPEEWAEHTVDFLSDVQSGGKHYDLFADPRVCVSPANEQNLHYECGETDPARQWEFSTSAHYERIADFALRWARRVNGLRPDRKALLCWPALAQGHDPDGNDVPDGEYQLPAIREAMAAYEIGASHPYGHDDWENGEATLPHGADAFWHMLRDFRPPGYRDQLEGGRPHDPGGALAQFPGKPWLFTEAGTFRHSDRDRTAVTLRAMRAFLQVSADAGADPTLASPLGATWFIGNTDAAHQKNNIGANPQLLDALANLEDYETAAAWPTAFQRRDPVTDIADALRAEFGSDFHDLRGGIPMASPGPARDLESIQAIAWHHTVSDVGWPAVAQYHVRLWGTSIAYPIGLSGESVFLLHDLNRLTPCVGPQNRSVLCVAVRGDYTQREPSAVELDRARRLVRVIRAHLGRNVPVRPHSAYRATACPGSWAAHLDDISAGADGSSPRELRWDKIRWSAEEIARRLRDEGYGLEHDWILENWRAEAREKELS